MTLKDYSGEIAKETGLTKEQIVKVISLLLSKIRISILRGEEVNLMEIGKFHLHVKKPHRYHDVQKKKFMITKVKYQLLFSVSRKLYQELKKKVVWTEKDY